MAEDGEHRHFDTLAARHGLLEHGGFGDRQPDVETDEHQYRARQERNAPAPREELLIAQPLRQHEEHAAGEEEPDWRTELRKHAVPGTLSRRRVFDREQDGTSPLTTESQA